MINFRDNQVRDILVDYLNSEFTTDRSQPDQCLVNQIREGCSSLSYDSKRGSNQAEKSAQMARACIQLDKIRDAMKCTFQAICHQEFSKLVKARFGISLNNNNGIRAHGWNETEEKRKAEDAAKRIWAGLFKNPPTH